ncbi:MAG: integrase core domain-containing protein [Victivallaceae bacterium]
MLLSILARPTKVIEGGCNASVIQRPTLRRLSLSVAKGNTLVEPLDGSKFWRNLLRLNKCRSRKARCLKNQDSAFFKHIERSSWTVATFAGAVYFPGNNKTAVCFNEVHVHKDVLWATDFFTSEVWTKSGLITYYVLFFVHIATRKIVIGGMTPHPNGEWMAQIARNISGFDGELIDAKYLIHDRDGKYTAQFDAMMKSAGVHPIRLPPRSPNLNAYAERFVLSIKSECLNKIVFAGEKSLRRTVKNYVEYYHAERNHQGMNNRIPFPSDETGSDIGEIKCKKRLGGLLKYYYREGRSVDFDIRKAG